MNEAETRAEHIGCELTLTLFRQPGMDDARFEADAQWVMRDLEVAKALLEARP